MTRRATAAGLVLALLATACGPVGSGGTGALPQSFSRGPIMGFGSIIVNNAHFDDQTAVVEGEDGELLSAQDDLHLGSTVALEADATSGTDAPPATAIRVLDDLTGSVTARFDPAYRQFTVMGQPVLVDATTFFDGIARGPAGLQVGDVVAVSALYEPVSGVYHATRVAPAPAGAGWVVRGAIGATDGSTFQIGGQSFQAQGVALPPGFAPGRLERVHVQAQRDGQGRWVVTALEDGVSVPPDGENGQLRGAVGAQLDETHAYVEGVLVDASTAAMHPSTYFLQPGSFVQVTGTMNAGTLVASRIDFRIVGEIFKGGGGQSDYGGNIFEIDGPITGPVDPGTLTFTMRGPTTVDASSATFEGGTAADLAAGRNVQVTGTLSGNGTRVAADTVTFVN